MKWMTPANAITLVLYGAFLGLLVGSMYYGRSAALTTYGNAEAQGEWNQWREKAPENRGGVDRRVPKSDEPPALVLMRDYFASCLALILLLGSALFFTFAFIIRGLLQPSVTPGRMTNEDVIPDKSA